MRMFHTQQDVHPNHIFCPAVTSPSDSPDFKPRVDWSKFHQVVLVEEEELKSPHLEKVSKSWGALSSASLTSTVEIIARHALHVIVSSIPCHDSSIVLSFTRKHALKEMTAQLECLSSASMD